MVAVGSGAAELHATRAGRLGDLLGRSVWTVRGIDDHGVYLPQPEPLAEAVSERFHLLKN